jgi:hypothetical protein
MMVTTCAAAAAQANDIIDVLHQSAQLLHLCGLLAVGFDAFLLRPHVQDVVWKVLRLGALAKEVQVRAPRGVRLNELEGLAARLRALRGR